MKKVLRYSAITIIIGFWLFMLVKYICSEISAYKDYQYEAAYAKYYDDFSEKGYEEGFDAGYECALRDYGITE